MFENEKMICPDCGALMNHHADIVDEKDALEAADAGVIKGAYACNGCGKTALRKRGDLIPQRRIIRPRPTFAYHGIL